MIKYPNGSKTIISELISVDKEPEYSSSEADQNGVEKKSTHSDLLESSYPF